MRLSRVPWTWLFIIAGIAAGVSFAIKFQDAYRGLSTALAAVSIGLGILWILAYRTNRKLGVTLEGLASKYSRLTSGLRRVVHLLPSEFGVADWRITHSIDEDGADSLREELTILPSGEPVYFYFKRYVVALDAGEKAIEVSAQNLLDNTPLAVFEVERVGGYIYYVILLDPPSTVTSPRRLAITCRRAAIWSRLFSYGEAEGSLQASHPFDSMRMEILAPRGRKWKGFHPAPLFGDVLIESSGSISRVTWTVKNAQPRKYVYQAYLESKTQ